MTPGPGISRPFLVEPAQLDFTGDDDVWVFVNGRLALDLGGWHPPLTGTVTINSGTAGTYGLVDGSVYEIAVFHAERMSEGSSFRLTLFGFNLAPSDCGPECGDGDGCSAACREEVIVPR